MPLRLNVGLSRKVGEPDFGSRGASLNLELELDTALIADPNRLRQQIRHLFDLANTSVEEELQGRMTPNGTGPAPGLPQVPGSSANPAPAMAPARGRGRTATASQVRALQAIAQRQQIDLGPLLAHRFRVSQVADLTLSEASQLIDDLKGTAGLAGGGR